MENQTREILLLKLGEVVLKGLNRRRFEDKLMANAARRLRKCGRFQISIRQSTIYAEPLDDNCNMDAAYQAAQEIFGIVRVARACPCEKDTEKIALAIKNRLSDEFQKARSFKVETKRADKNFYLNSIEISRDVGGRLSDFFPAVKVAFRGYERVGAAQFAVHDELVDLPVHVRHLVIVGADEALGHGCYELV